MESFAAKIFELINFHDQLTNQSIISTSTFCSACKRLISKCYTLSTLGVCQFMVSLAPDKSA